MTRDMVQMLQGNVGLVREWNYCSSKNENWKKRDTKKMKCIYCREC